MLIGVSFIPPLPVVVVMLFLGMMCLGAGNGSVFQLVPQRFGNEIGLMTGIVGAAGGFGGYALPLILGQLYSSYQSYTPGFVILSLIAAASLFLVLVHAIPLACELVEGRVTKQAESHIPFLLATTRPC